MGKIKRRRMLFLLILLTLAWMAVIYGFSARDSTDSAEMSSALLKKLLRLVIPEWGTLGLKRQREIFSALHHGFRKCGHFTEYAVLGALLAATVRYIKKSRRVLLKMERWLPALLSLGYAASDEWHQRFVAGRSGELRDVVIDFAGACLGILVTRKILEIFGRRRRL